MILDEPHTTFADNNWPVATIHGTSEHLAPINRMARVTLTTPLGTAAAESGEGGRGAEEGDPVAAEERRRRAQWW